MATPGGPTAGVTAPSLGRFACVPGSVRIIEQGPVRNITEAVLAFGRSWIVYHTIAYAAWPVLEFRLRVHWNEQRRRLKLVGADAADDPRASSARCRGAPSGVRLTDRSTCIVVGSP